MNKKLSICSLATSLLYVVLLIHPVWLNCYFGFYQIAFISLLTIPLVLANILLLSQKHRNQKLLLSFEIIQTLCALTIFILLSFCTDIYYIIPLYLGMEEYYFTAIEYIFVIIFPIPIFFLNLIQSILNVKRPSKKALS